MTTPSFPERPETRSWYVVDAKDYPLGRLASRVASILRGKHKPIYSPHVDHGDHVVVVNAALVQLTGKKLVKKTFFRHTGYISGVKIETLKDKMAQEPEEVVRRAVRGMLPKTRLGRSMLSKLKVYPGSEHPHRAQGPVPLRLEGKGKGTTDGASAA
jgi:large subunit ribosomal protein L13